MTRSRIVRSALGAGLLLAACGGDERPAVDAGPCWPLNATPGGQVQIGTGDITFEPMPDVLPIINNLSQSDPYLQVHARIHGIPPGNSEDALDPRNPKTKLSAVITDLNPPLDVVFCPASIGYVASSEPGAFDLLHSLRIGFMKTPLDQVSGKQARITVEVVGSNGLYAKDEKLVTLMTPAAPGAVAGAAVPAAAGSP
jgi:hypothetical protein